MSDAVTVALIGGVFTVLTQVVSRWMSHFEHKKTAKDVADIKNIVNGK